MIKIKLVKPEKALGIENAIMQAAKTGMLKNRVSEQELIVMLERDSAKSAENNKVTVIHCLYIVQKKRN